jgi:hypothetical protein
MLKIIKPIGLFIIIMFLLANLGSPVAAEFSKPSFNEILADTLDTSIDNSTLVNESDNPVISRIKFFNPNATVGEVIAVNVMLGEQLNQSNNGFDLNLYFYYCNNSSSYPITGVDLTARELYAQAPGVRSFIDGLDNVLIRYSHMSKEEKVEFLLTKTPSNDLTEEILDNADADELTLLSQKAFTAFDNFPDYDYDDITKANTIKKDVEGHVDKFNNDVQYYDKYFQVYGDEEHLRSNVSIANNTSTSVNINETTDINVLRMLKSECLINISYLENEKQPFEDTKDKIIKSGLSLSGIGAGLLALASCNHCSYLVNGCFVFIWCFSAIDWSYADWSWW